MSSSILFSIAFLLWLFNLRSIIRDVLVDSVRFPFLLPFLPCVLGIFGVIHIDINIVIKIILIIMFISLEVSIDFVIPEIYRRKRSESTPLHKAIIHNDIHTAIEIIDHFPNTINDRSGYLISPLEQAAMKGNLDIVKHLVSHGANMEAMIDPVWGRSRLGALGIAASKGHIDIAGYLIQHGAPINNPDGAGSMALIAAIRQGQTDMVRLLLEHGADLRTPNDAMGDSAIDAAANSGQTDITQMLIDAGADLREVNRWGRTPYEEALIMRHRRVAELIKRHGGAGFN